MGLISSVFSCTGYLLSSNISFMIRCRASKKFLLSRQILRTSFFILSASDDFELFSFSLQDSISFFQNGQVRISFIVSKAFLPISFCFFQH